MKIIDAITKYNVLSAVKLTKLPLDEKMAVLDTLIELKNVGKQLDEYRETARQTLNGEELTEALNKFINKDVGFNITPLSRDTITLIFESNPDIEAGRMAEIMSLCD